MQEPHEQPESARDQILNERPPVVPHTDALTAWWARHRLAHGRRPLLGATIVGGTALALAASFGPLELAVGALAAYTAYRMLRYGIDLRQALIDTIEVEHIARRDL
jgi:hypothetical protein